MPLENAKLPLEKPSPRVEDREQAGQSNISSAWAKRGDHAAVADQGAEAGETSSIGASMATGRSSPAKRARRCRLPA